MDEFEHIYIGYFLQELKSGEHRQGYSCSQLSTLSSQLLDLIQITCPDQLNFVLLENVDTIIKIIRFNYHVGRFSH